MTSTHQPNKSDASKSSDWRQELNKSVRQSINFFSDQNNLTKEEQSNIKGWVVAGPNKDNIRQFNLIAKQIGLKEENGELSNEGYGINELQLKGYKAGQRKDFARLSKVAEKLDLALWQEVEQINVSNGAINQNEITEGAFDPDLTDAVGADDINGDGISDPLFHLLASDPANGNARGMTDELTCECGRNRAPKPFQ